MTPRSSMPATSSEALAADLRQFNRSPHPYHLKNRRRYESSENGDHLRPPSSRLKPSRTPSDSGTEADDESTGILRGLPAPPLRGRKGLRSGLVETDPWLTTLQPWPPILVRRSSWRSSGEEADEEVVRARQKLGRKRRAEIVRRLLETALLLSVGVVVLLQRETRSLAWAWRKGIVMPCWW